GQDQHQPLALSHEPPVVRLEGITKTFPGGVVANQSVDLSLFAGEIHALVGENGAGKTTLMNTLFGLYEPDAGQIFVDGKPVHHRSPAEAIRNGIGMVHQHFKLIPSFTVAENLLLGRFRSAGFRLAPGKVAKDAEDLASRYGVEVRPNALAGELPLA